MNDSRLAAWLVADQLVGQSEIDSALEQASRERRPLADVVVENDLIAESAMLKHIAQRGFRSRLRQGVGRYITSKRLAEFWPSPELIKLVPAKSAKRAGVLPLSFDADKRVLSFASWTPVEPNLPELHAAEPLATTSPVAALRCVIDAALRKVYDGDACAFDGLDVKIRANIATLLVAYSWECDDEQTQVQQMPAPPNEPPQIPQPADEPYASIIRDTPDTPAEEIDVVEFLDVIMRSRPEFSADRFSGHSTEVAHLSSRVAEKLGFTETRVRYVALAAYLHDVGKRSAHHTLLSMRHNAQHAEVARDQYLIPSNMFFRAHLPKPVRDALIHIYEHFDGSGFPGGLAGPAIPEGARIVAAVDACLDLTLNAENYSGVVQAPTDALEIVSKYAEILFDPDVVRALSKIVTLDENRKRLDATRPWVLLVDPVAKDVSEHEIELARCGFNVVVCTSSTAARRQLRERNFDVIVSEVNDTPEDGFDLLLELRRIQRGTKTPFIFHSHVSDAIFIRHAYALGAIDYLVKPVLPEVLVAKVQQIVETKNHPTALLSKGHGIVGTVADITIPDVIHLLAQAKKSGQLLVKTGVNQGVITLDHGAVVDAISNDRRGEDAFKSIVGWNDGEFAFDPDVGVHP
ncbi:MAG: DUF4388 domain-containing protein [Deltaproteobacteria bacterium]|nr:DUF4388 domain-containing protein [Deltaproteobacteria bacterium]